VIEELARKIGYQKVKAITSSADIVALKEFIQKTGLRVKVSISPEMFSKDNITAVPVTIVTTKDGKKHRFDGLTPSFIQQAQNTNDSNQIFNIIQNSGNSQQKCSSK